MYKLYLFYLQLNKLNGARNNSRETVATLSGHKTEPKFADLLKSDNLLFTLPNHITKYLNDKDEIGAIGLKNESTNSSGK